MSKPFKTFFNKHWPLIKSLLIFLVFSAAIALTFQISGIFDFFNAHWIEQHIRNQDWQGIVLLICIIGLGTSCGLPRQVAAFLSGYAIGVTYGTLVATFAATLGCSITFFSARYLAQPFLLKRYPDKVTIINRFLQHKTFQKTVIIRLIPAGNNFLLNLAAGVGQIKAWRFIGASYIGFFPQMIIFALAGSGLQLMSYWQLTSSGVLSVVAGLLSYRLYTQYQQELKSNE